MAKPDPLRQDQPNDNYKKKQQLERLNETNVAPVQAPLLDKSPMSRKLSLTYADNCTNYWRTFPRKRCRGLLKQALMGTVTFILNLPAVFEREGDWTVGRFPDIDVASQGRTREEAERNLVEAAQLFIESCFERNVLDEVLKACGFAPGHSATNLAATI